MPNALYMTVHYGLTSSLLDMDTLTFAAILAAAFMHAAWNAMIKIGLDRFMSMALMGTCMGGIALALTPFFPLPAPESWPFIIASILCHIGYNLTLVRAYGLGDLGQIYPLARGTAPLSVALFGAFVLAEALPPLGWIGILVLVGGVWLMSFKGGREKAQLHRHAVVSALFVSGFISAYTILDGIGGRASGSASGYTLWLLGLEGVVMVAIALAVRGPKAIIKLRGVWVSGLIAGALSLSAYWIAIWAMTRAPIAAVAALRETSILFALAISVIALKEPLTRWRTAAAIMIVAGAAVLRLV
ncbi:drug/metabolite transporter (DMT)-like permease [Rhodoligotrophos appendicifer]|uniref:EamA family transporter n=1 Tax=Rhodoligotrophos appendicifer TaxID=987056 RepID=UPI001FE3140E|nr:EamA family transporter [Rhodoligotrophos appendicifer]